MKIECHLKQNKTEINCGSGKNTIRWLADAASTWYIEANTIQQKKQKIASTPIKVMKNTGQELDMNETILKLLENNDSVYVYFKEDIEWQILGRGK